MAPVPRSGGMATGPSAAGDLCVCADNPSFPNPTTAGRHELSAKTTSLPGALVRGRSHDDVATGIRPPKRRSTAIAKERNRKDRSLDGLRPAHR